MKSNITIELRASCVAYTGVFQQGYILQGDGGVCLNTKRINGPLECEKHPFFKVLLIAASANLLHRKKEKKKGQKDEGHAGSVLYSVIPLQ